MLTAAQIFSSRVPRYTSYPTAPHFHAGINDISYRQWLSELPPQSPLSLYIHIPFCDTLCWFCGCNTTVVNSYRPVENYCATLLCEIQKIAQSMAGRNPVTHIHWGGGSPTILKTEEMHRLNGAIRELFNVTADAQIAIEIDPRGFTSELGKTLVGCGVNRASVGLQDCNPNVQRAINRIQEPEELLKTIAILHDVGIHKINLDLIYGLPHQTTEGMAKNIDLAVSIKPSRIAIFGYAHVPAFKRHQALIHDADLPDVDARLGLAQLAQQRLCAVGYEAVGIDHFAMPDDELALAVHNRTLRRNFQGYTTDKATTLLGLGASAISSLEQGYLQNHSTVAAYRGALEAERLATAKGIALGREDKLRRHVIEQLMCFMSVNIKQCSEQFGAHPSILEGVLPSLKPLLDVGAVAIEGQRISVNPDWRPAARLVSALFDSYLDGGAFNHSLSA